MELIKTAMASSVLSSIMTEIVNRNARYYFYIGNVAPFNQDDTETNPIDSQAYEFETRNKIVTLKSVKPSDISLVIPRYDWKSGDIYDRFDDTYGSELVGLNLISGGSGYTSAPEIVIFGGGGTGAVATCTVNDGAIVSVKLTQKGSGYNSVPTINIVGVGTGASIEAVTSKPNNGYTLEQSKFYVMTDNYNVYKCIDNNKNAASTYKPSGTSKDPIAYPDGYVWKYMYNVPLALRSKFLTSDLVPVTTSIKNQYYNNGSIVNTRRLSGGSGYTYATIVVDGDGYLEKDPVFITGATVTMGGTGYPGSPTVTISPPFAASAWISGGTVLVGQYISHAGNIYKTKAGGTFSTTAPSHTSGLIINGGVPLEYVGTTATAVATVSSGVITGVSFRGSVKEFIITNGGSGYIANQTITVSGGGGTGVVASAIVSGGAVTDFVLTNGGSNFSSEPTVTVGTAWTATTALSLNAQVFVANRLYTVTTAGTTSSTAPTHSSGALANGTATLTYVGVPATLTSKLRFGAGYQSAPTVSISGGTGFTGSVQTAKSSAILKPVFSSGQITGLIIVDGGVGYSTATINIVGNGTGASYEVDLSIGDLDTLQADVELLAVDGDISSIQVVSGGYGYTTATVKIEGEGTGATATANIIAGKISSINLLTRGSGYRKPIITITGDGKGATARGVVSPVGGHGKNAIKELYARNIMFYTELSSDKNQGLEIDNDFRQIGIIKDPSVFGEIIRASSELLTSCYLVNGTSIPTFCNIDDILRSPRTILGQPYDALYRVVAKDGQKLLLEDMTNVGLSTTHNLLNGNGDLYDITAVVNPTVDKFSGDLLVIDNKQSFAPSSEEKITLRTIIGINK